MPAQGSADVARVASRVARVRRLCVLTGAGMSAESGVPTFRDAMTGLWSTLDPAALASEAGFRADPARVWSWYCQRREGVRQARPNAGHLALAAFARRRPGVLSLVTQNVDDLHQRAGNVDAIGLHGSLLASRWLDSCPQSRPCDIDSALAGGGPNQPPRCGHCGNLVRPGVVWFGEQLDPQLLRQASQAARGCELMLVVGTSGVVWPAAGLAGEAAAAGAEVVVVNPQASALDAVAHRCLRGTAASLLPRLLAAS